MTYVERRTKSIIKGVSSALALFLGFLTFLFIAVPKPTTHGSHVGLSGPEIAYADVPVTSGDGTGGVVSVNPGTSSSAAGGGDGCDDDGGDDDGDDDGG